MKSRRTRFHILAVFVGAICLAFAIHFSHRSEPGYQGRSLSDWLEQWSSVNYDPTDSAAVAIKAIGTNAMPDLLDRISQDVSPSTRRLEQMFRPVIPNKFLPIERFVDSQFAVAYAIRLLGTNAMPFFPRLTNIFFTTQNAMPAATALSGMGHEGVVVLLQGLTNGNIRLEIAAATGLGDTQTDSEEVIAALIKFANGGRSPWREIGASSLLHLHERMDLVVPVFIQFLQSSNSGERSFAATMLGTLGPSARAGIPALQTACSDQNPQVREVAEQTLKQIDPSSFTTNAASR